MIKEFEKVKIVSKDICGVVVDKYEKNGEWVYIVEGDEWVESDNRSGGDYPLYDCHEDDLIDLSKSKGGKIPRKIAVF